MTQCDSLDASRYRCFHGDPHLERGWQVASSSKRIISAGTAKPRAWPFYIVCDVSQSMWHKPDPSAGETPFETVDRSLPKLIKELNVDDQARDVAHLCVLAFADAVQEVLPLTRLRNVKAIASLNKGSFTNYEKILQHLTVQIAADFRRLRQTHELYTPTVFFLTDGIPRLPYGPQHPREWLPPLEELKSEEYVGRPSIVALGFGEIGAETLRVLASDNPPGAACISEKGIPASSLLQAIIDSIIFSVTDSTAKGHLIFDTPKGMRRLC